MKIRKLETEEKQNTKKLYEEVFSEDSKSFVDYYYEEKLKDNQTIYRIYEKASGKIKADLICFADEVIDPKQDLLLFDPMDTWKKTKLAGGTYTVREILLPIFKNGECLYKSPTLKEIAAYCREEKDTLWDETKRLFYPHRVYVDLSQKLYAVKQSLLDQMTMTD